MKWKKQRSPMFMDQNTQYCQYTFGRLPAKITLNFFFIEIEKLKLNFYGLLKYNI